MSLHVLSDYRVQLVRWPYTAPRSIANDLLRYLAGVDAALRRHDPQDAAMRATVHLRHWLMEFRPDHDPLAGTER